MKNLDEVILLLKNRKEVEGFLKDLCTPAELKAEQGALKGTQTNSSVVASVTNTSMQKILLPFAWIVVGVPITLGILNALQKGIIIFL